MRKPTVLGGALLVAGNAIGAAMLGLPILTGKGGFGPSFILLIGVWLFMSCTGFLLLEVNLRMPPGANIVSMARSTLGRLGGGVAWLIYLFLFYGLMVAYLSGGATILTAVIDRVSGAQVPIWTMILISLAIYGALIYGGTRTVDPVNRLLMVGLILAYGLLVIVGLPHVKATNLAHHSWSHVWMALPAMVTSFGFHNIVPTLRDYLHSNVKKLRLALAIGTAMPLLIYLLWQVIILGVLPLQGENGIEAALEQGLEATTALRATTGALVVTDVAQWFALFAIVTSFLGVALSFVDFLADGLKIPKNRTGLAGLCALALLPPVVLALTNPSIFLSALGFAGGICAVIVFGIFPPLMCFVARRRSHAKRMVPGGRFPLIACIAISVAIFVIEMVALVAP